MSQASATTDEFIHLNQNKKQYQTSVNLISIIYIHRIIRNKTFRISIKEHTRSFSAAMSCPDCFRGSIHEGNPRGKEIELHGLPTYVVEPVNRDVKGIIIFITDAFGWKFGNSRLLCDSYADNSAYRVYMPDFMDG